MFNHHVSWLRLKCVKIRFTSPSKMSCLTMEWKALRMSTKRTADDNEDRATIWVNARTYMVANNVELRANPPSWSGSRMDSSAGRNCPRRWEWISLPMPSINMIPLIPSMRWLTSFFAMGCNSPPLPCKGSAPRIHTFIINWCRISECCWEACWRATGATQSIPGPFWVWIRQPMASMCSRDGRLSRGICNGMSAASSRCAAWHWAYFWWSNPMKISQNTISAEKQRLQKFLSHPLPVAWLAMPWQHRGQSWEAWAPPVMWMLLYKSH